jgi:Delta7-sterol 5-desaturase
MLVRLLGLPDDPIVVFLVISVFGLVYYFTLAGISYGIFFGWLRPRLFPTYRPDRAELGAAARLSVISIVGNAALTMPIHLLIAAGRSRIYFHVGDYGYGWLAAQCLLMLVFTETCVYWVHWALHRVPFLWKHIHAYHHRFKTNTPLVGVAFHPFDSFAQAFAHHLAVFLFPVHVGVYLFSVSFVTLWAVMIHDRVSLVRVPGLNYTGHHTLHHWYSDYNLGQYTTFWDRLVGTYRSPEGDYPDIPDEVLKPHLALAGEPAAKPALER